MYWITFSTCVYARGTCQTCVWERYNWYRVWIALPLEFGTGWRKYRLSSGGSTIASMVACGATRRKDIFLANAAAAAALDTSWRFAHTAIPAMVQVDLKNDLLKKKENEIKKENEYYSQVLCIDKFVYFFLSLRINKFDVTRRKYCTVGNKFYKLKKIHSIWKNTVFCILSTSFSVIFIKLKLIFTQN